MQWFEWGVGMSGWGKGQRRDPLPFRSTAGAQHSIGTIICIESIYPEVARDMVLNGADVLAVITNDAWFNGTPGPWQHEVIARMRAIETRRSIVRCANSGISAMIRPSGDDDVLTPMQRGALIGTLPTSTAITPFVRIGNVLPIACLILIILAALATRFPALLRNMRLSPTH
jgi:apolipoprotein N-acyltransferase